MSQGGDRKPGARTGGDWQCRPLGGRQAHHPEGKDNGVADEAGQDDLANVQRVREGCAMVLLRHEVVREPCACGVRSDALSLAVGVPDPCRGGVGVAQDPRAILDRTQYHN